MTGLLFYVIWSISIVFVHLWICYIYAGEVSTMPESLKITQDVVGADH
jgi:hypothetical protein